MPEGDTILRAAQTLQKAIGGQTISKFESSLPEIRRASKGLLGKRITEVTARGKNLLIHFEDGPVLRTHLRMHGSWHIYRPGERWRITPGAARVVIEAGEWVAVCFSAPTVELIASNIETHPVIGSLGPDVLSETFDLQKATELLLSASDREIGEVILDQTLVAGIGNVYKSEVLFITRTDPRATPRELGEERIVSILEEAKKQMRANMGTNARRTRGLTGENLWVYRRSGKNCLRCGETIRMIRQSELLRSTYYCPSCQVRSS
jgi:endonuclease-8